MTNIAQVIGWKFNHQPGMRCEENEQGVLAIVEFPGGIPTQAEQDQWTAEYEARDIAVERIDRAFPQTDVARVIFEVFFEFANEIRALQDAVNGTTQGAVTKSQFKDYLKTKLP